MQNVLKKILKHTFEMCLPNVLMMEVIRVHKVASCLLVLKDKEYCFGWMFPNVCQSAGRMESLAINVMEPNNTRFL